MSLRLSLPGGVRAPESVLVAPHRFLATPKRTPAIDICGSSRTVACPPRARNGAPRLSDWVKFVLATEHRQQGIFRNPIMERSSEHLGCTRRDDGCGLSQSVDAAVQSLRDKVDGFPVGPVPGARSGAVRFEENGALVKRIQAHICCLLPPV